MLDYNSSILTFYPKSMIILRSPFDKAWENKDPFEEILLLGGTSYRSVKTRETSRFDFMGKSYFIKYHEGTTLTEIIKNLITFKLPVIGADQEWAAIHHLKDHGVDTMVGVAFGSKGWNPLTRQSFLITEDLSPVEPLDAFFQSPRGKSLSFENKQRILKRVAEMTRKMHLSGLNHRDCYLCHYMLDTSRNLEDELKISIIDLHRAQIRHRVPKRWRDKDLIGLYFSSLDLGFTQRDIYRFLKNYFQMPLRKIFAEERELMINARKRVLKIQAHTDKLYAKP